MRKVILALWGAVQAVFEVAIHTLLLPLMLLMALVEWIFTLVSILKKRRLTAPFGYAIDGLMAPIAFVVLVLLIPAAIVSSYGEDFKLAYKRLFKEKAIHIRVNGRDGILFGELEQGGYVSVWISDDSRSTFELTPAGNLCDGGGRIIKRTDLEVVRGNFIKRLKTKLFRRELKKVNLEAVKR